MVATRCAGSEAPLKSDSYRLGRVPRCRASLEALVTFGKSAQAHPSCPSTTAVDEPRGLARMDCPPGLLVGRQRRLDALRGSKASNRLSFPALDTPSPVHAQKSGTGGCSTSKSRWQLPSPQGQSITKGLIRRGDGGQVHFNNSVPRRSWAATRGQFQPLPEPVPDRSRSSHPSSLESR